MTSAATAVVTSSLAISTSVTAIATEGGQAVPIMVQLSEPAPAGGLEVSYSWLGSASPLDYTVAAGTGISSLSASSMRIAAGATQASLLVTANSDTLNEPSEYLRLVVNPGTGYTVANAAMYFATPLTLTTAASNPHVVVGDFDGDRRLDVVGVNEDAQKITWLKGDGAGGFAVGVQISVGGKPSDASVGDFNLDGFSDLAVTLINSNQVAIALGSVNGLGTWTTYGVGNSPRYSTTGDFNGDGLLDIAVANLGQTVSLLIGKGNGAFDLAKTYASGGAPHQPVAVDVNRDGRQDIALADMATGKLLVHLTDANGGLGSASSYTVGSSPQGVTSGDFNGDGLVDVAVANRDSNSVSVLLANPAGGFATATNIAVGFGPTTLSAADLDGDGVLGLVVANRADNTVQVLKGLGDGKFVSVGAFSLGSDPYGIATGDFDRDGADDVVAGARGGSALTVGLSRPQPDALLILNKTNSLPNGGVTISGTPKQGQTLTATNTLVDADGLGAISYTWKAGGATVGTGATYTLTQAEVGKTITVEASYLDGFGTQESVESVPSSTISIAEEIISPILSYFSLDSVLIDGESVEFSYIFEFSGAVSTIEIAGVHFYSPTGSSRIFAPNLSVFDGVVTVPLKLGKYAVSGDWYIAEINWFTDDGEFHVLYNDALRLRGLETTIAVNNPDGDDGLPVLDNLVLSTSLHSDGLRARIEIAPKFNDVGGSGIASIGFQMIPPDGDDASKYVASRAITQGEDGEIFVIDVDRFGAVGEWKLLELTAIDQAGNFRVYYPEEISSLGFPISVNLEFSDENSPPSGSIWVTGTATQGQTLTALNTLADADGLGAITYTWKAGGATVGTGSIYTLTQAEVGKTITVTASYTDGGGFAESVASGPTVAVVASTGRTGLTGLAYHWKSHALLDKVAVRAVDQGAVSDAPTQLFDLRSAALDQTTGKLTVEVWANPEATVETIDFTAAGPAGSTLTFTSALGTDWTPLTNTSQPGQLLLGAYLSNISATGLTVPTRVGTLEVQLAAGTSDVQIAFSEIQVGASSVPDLALGMAGATTGADGAFEFTTLPAGNFGLSATRAAGDGTNGVTSADALAALRLAVGINPNSDPDGTGPQQALKVSPYQFMAADANQDGKVSAADALAILRMAVRLPTALPQEWFFVEETRDLWNEITGQSALTRTAATWDRSINATAPGEVNLVGVLKGDVNGSWTAPAGTQDLDVLEPGYFTDLAQRIGAPLDQFGVYSGG